MTGFYSAESNAAGPLSTNSQPFRCRKVGDISNGRKLELTLQGYACLRSLADIAPLARRLPVTRSSSESVHYRLENKVVNPVFHSARAKYHMKSLIWPMLPDFEFATSVMAAIAKPLIAKSSGDRHYIWIAGEAGLLKVTSLDYIFV